MGSRGNRRWAAGQVDCEGVGRRGQNSMNPGGRLRRHRTCQLSFAGRFMAMGGHVDLRVDINEPWVSSLGEMKLVELTAWTGQVTSALCLTATRTTCAPDDEAKVSYWQLGSMLSQHGRGAPGRRCRPSFRARRTRPGGEGGRGGRELARRPHSLASRLPQRARSIASPSTTDAMDAARAKRYCPILTRGENRELGRRWWSGRGG